MKKCANSKLANESYWNVYTAQYRLLGFLGLLDMPPFHILSDFITQIIIVAVHPVKMRA